MLDGISQPIVGNPRMSCIVGPRMPKVRPNIESGHTIKNACCDQYWLVVWNIFYFPIYWE